MSFLRDQHRTTDVRRARIDDTNAREIKGFPASVVDLTFDSASQRVLKSNVKSKTTLESYICQCPFGSDIRKRTRRDIIRMLEAGHWPPLASGKAAPPF